MPKGIWKKGKKTVTGSWEYIWHQRCFLIVLDSKDPITGQTRRLKAYGDEPEWGKWKLHETKG